MNILLLSFVCVVIYSIGHVNGSYFVPQKLLGEMDQRYGSATFIRNKTVYNYGGNTYADQLSNGMSSTSLSSIGNVVYEELPTSPTDPHCSYPSTVYLPGNDTVLLFCGELSDDSDSTILTIWSYNFDTQNPTWTEIAPIIDQGLLTVEARFNAVLGSNGKVYIYFNYLTTTANKTNEFISFDPTTRHITDLSKNIPLHLLYTSTVALPNGLIVFSAGKTKTDASTAEFMPANQVYVYNVNDNTWRNQLVSGYAFLPRNYPNSALGSDNQTIFLFGGISPHLDGVDAMYNDLLLLNTTTWSWSLFEAGGYPPAPRLYASMGFIQDDILSISFGILTPNPRNDVNFLRYSADEKTPSYWMRDWEEYQNGQTPVVVEKKGLKPGAIAGIAIGSLAALALMSAYLWNSWSPRSGEPIWAEISRIVFQCIGYLLLAAYLVYIIMDVVNSPKAIITLRNSALTLKTPDIRFCFDGWNNSLSVNEYLRPHMRCSTDEGYDCTQHITSLNMSIHKPAFSEHMGEITCFLYAAPSKFVLTDPTRRIGNGSSLDFSFYGDPTASGAIHAVFFPPGMDPNIILYNINTTDIDPIITPEQMDDWVVADLGDRYAENVYTINPNSTTTLGYELQSYQHLTDDGWNNVGFSPNVEKIPQISTTFRSGTMSKGTRSLAYIISTLKVFPNEYVDVILQEKKTSTLLDALGSAGGVLSLIMGVQLWLFGFRPQSPWGVVHRWSIGRMSHSIKESLRSGFDPTHKSIPFVDPIGQPILSSNSYYNSPHIATGGLSGATTAASAGGGVVATSSGSGDICATGYSDIEGKDTAQLLTEPGTQIPGQLQRLSQVEERMQLMEQMLKAYYIDTEIFKQFSQSVKTSQPDLSRLDVVESIPITESGEMRQRLWGRDNV
ncbi:hypothetical protein J3Q64DRAFT_1651298 [Phycomyces blakesleeanus]|uniref:Galactose oxidase n=1 Tax=Phycomyces blakesleeanus TaxID=4837 RepID=A0ABR3BDD3_PHYBL